MTPSDVDISLEHPAQRRSRRRITRPWATVVVGAMVAALCLLSGGGAASAGTYTCTSTTSFKSVAYCNGSIADLKAGKYPLGTKIALRSVFVFSVFNKVREVGELVPCPPGRICGAMLNWVTTKIDFSGLSAGPGAYYWTAIYGTTKGTALVPAGFQQGEYWGPPEYW